MRPHPTNSVARTRPAEGLKLESYMHARMRPAPRPFLLRRCALAGSGSAHPTLDGADGQDEDRNHWDDDRAAPDELLASGRAPQRRPADILGCWCGVRLHAHAHTRHAVWSARTLCRQAGKTAIRRGGSRSLDVQGPGPGPDLRRHRAMRPARVGAVCGAGGVGWGQLLFSLNERESCSEECVGHLNSSLRWGCACVPPPMPLGVPAHARWQGGGWHPYRLAHACARAALDLLFLLPLAHTGRLTRAQSRSQRTHVDTDAPPPAGSP